METCAENELQNNSMDEDMVSDSELTVEEEVEMDDCTEYTECETDHTATGSETDDNIDSKYMILLLIQFI